MNLKIMTFNIQHGHVHLSDHIDLEKMCDVIRECDPDIVALQEVRGRGTHKDYTAQAEAMAASLNMHCYFGRSIMVGGTSPYGNAVLSKFPILEAQVIRIPDPVNPVDTRRAESRSLCRAVVSAQGRELAVYVTHFGLTAEEQEHAVSTTLTTLEGEPRPFVLMGDLNMRPDNPLIAKLNEKLVSTDDMLAGQFSFPSDAPKIKIDYIFASHSVTVTHAEILPILASDHCPIAAEISF